MATSEATSAGQDPLRPRWLTAGPLATVTTRAGAGSGLVVAAIVLAAALRLYRLGSNSFWIDEFMTLWLASHSLGEIASMSSTENFIPPLYFLLVHSALQMLGESEVTLRLPSAIAGFCTIPIVWCLTAEITRSRSTAHIVGALLAFNPLHLWFSQEARPYALLLFFGCCTLLALARATRRGTVGSWSMFSLLGALTCLVHTTGLIFMVVAWAWALMLGGRRVVRPLLLSFFGATLMCTPFYIPVAQALVASRGTFHSPPRPLTGLEAGYTLLTYVTGFSFGPGPRDIQNAGAMAALRDRPVQSAVAGVVLAGMVALTVLKRRRAMVPFVGMVGITLAGVFVLSALSGKAYNVRYTLPGLIGFLALIGIAMRAVAPKPRVLGLSALTGLSLWADAQWYYSVRYWKEDSRAAVAWLSPRVAPGSTIAVAPAYGTRPLAYYAQEAGADLRFVPEEAVDSDPGGRAPAALVLTRLHHVPSWRKLKADFLGAAGDRVLEGRVAGYEMLVDGANSGSAESRIR